jgi:5-methylcytosine-specific restriction endonuclease McrA
MEALVHGAKVSDYYRCRKVNVTACQKCKDAAAEYERNRRLSNIEHYKTVEKAWRDRNLKKARETERRYRQNNPELQKRKDRIKRARKKNVLSAPYLTKDVIDLWGVDCHICGLSIDMRITRRCGEIGWEEGLHLDHVIPLSKNGPDIISNVKPSHARCNLEKSAKTATA